MQNHKLLIGYINKALTKNLTERKVGKAIKVETNVHGAGNFVRVRVILDVRAGQREFYQVKYEKLPKFCGACCFMGHIHLEYGSSEHEEAKLKWGDFLKADWDTWHGRGIGGTRGGGQSGYRGRGREAPMAERSDLGCGKGCTRAGGSMLYHLPLVLQVLREILMILTLALLRTRTWR
jgi:hypothetical protein